MNPPVPLDLGDFFFCKIYGQLMGWSTPVDFGPWCPLNWAMTSWTRQEWRGGRSRQIPRQNVRWRGRIAIFELTSTIKRPRLQKRGWGWPQSIKGLHFSFLHTYHFYTHSTPFLLLHLFNFCYTYYTRDNSIW
jgi:hypothetical protein